MQTADMELSTGSRPTWKCQGATSEAGVCRVAVQCWAPMGPHQSWPGQLTPQMEPQGSSRQSAWSRGTDEVRLRGGTGSNTVSGLSTGRTGLGRGRSWALEGSLYLARPGLHESRLTVHSAGPGCPVPSQPWSCLAPASARVDKAPPRAWSAGRQQWAFRPSGRCCRHGHRPACFSFCWFVPKPKGRGALAPT